MEVIFARWPAILKYDPATGDLLLRYLVEAPHRDRESLTREEALATYKVATGTTLRNMVRIDGYTLQAAKVVWLLHRREWPDDLGRIGWKNGDTTDDRIENLEIKVGQSTRGKARTRPKGVAKYYDRWQAYVRFPDGTQKGLGIFRTEEEAIAARGAWDAAQDLV